MLPFDESSKNRFVEYEGDTLEDIFNKKNENQNKTTYNKLDKRQLVMETRISLKFILYIIIVWLLSSLNGGDFGINIGGPAATKLISPGLRKLIEKPKWIQVEMTSHKDVYFNNFIAIDLDVQLDYKNFSFKFDDQRVWVIVDNVKIESLMNINVFHLPSILGKTTTKMNASVPRAELSFLIDNYFLKVDTCAMKNVDIDATIEKSFIANALIKLASISPSSIVEFVLCKAMSKAIHNIDKYFSIDIPIINILPPVVSSQLKDLDTILSIHVVNINASDDILSLTSNAEVIRPSIPSENLPIKLNIDRQSTIHAMLENNDRITLWVEDRLVNDLLNMIEWNFMWLEKEIPFSSPLLPPKSRDHMMLLCENCYYLAQVTSNGTPNVTAHKGYFVYQKADIVTITTVNPEKNKQIKFIAFNVSITLEIRSIFENGIARIQINLLDTDINLGEGVVSLPNDIKPHVQNMTRNLILDVIFPNLKEKIESLLYSEGIKIPANCGIDGKNIHILFDEGLIGLSSSVMLDELDLTLCLKNAKDALPKSDKIMAITNGLNFSK
ncbi:Bactericidal permeability-increasing protein, alpha/beta domain-containing protein [Strongyloides ratti]|uniref:Bactericidal permeability-increasing protein, alpha/beta domain-containing protein n=1 Tax=Strongyloides ratti TaxID=34506 RepID=A0A090LV98_STRRB|nr:Bactericidal permeability-increasing protein, alpha/beta domain-containing protein [Strongyloides ratti]CEF71589.1 Bactericidal permeability-increasing protein, alpha/beta domain-containing protein [Strongyloides ratti]